MKKVLFHSCCIVVMLTVLATAGDLNTAFELLRSEDIDPYNPSLKQDIYGNAHAVYLGHGCINYFRINPQGETVFPIVQIREKHVVEGIDVAPCINGVAVVLWLPVHGHVRFAVIDSNGNIRNDGVLADQSFPPRSFFATDGNSILWGCNTGQETDSNYNLPILLEVDDARLYAASQSVGRDAYAFGLHMVKDGHILVFTYKRGPNTPGVIDRFDYTNLIVYEYNTWQGSIVDSAAIPLISNSGILQIELPFERVQILDDVDNSLLVFASYYNPEDGRQLRVIRLSPDLEVLDPPALEIRSDLPSIDISTVTKCHDVIWFEHDMIGGTVSLHQLAITKDILYHSRIYDIHLRKERGKTGNK